MDNALEQDTLALMREIGLTHKKGQDAQHVSREKRAERPQKASHTVKAEPRRKSRTNSEPSTRPHTYENGGEASGAPRASVAPVQKQADARASSWRPNSTPRTSKVQHKRHKQSFSACEWTKSTLKHPVVALSDNYPTWYSHLTKLDDSGKAAPRLPPSELARAREVAQQLLQQEVLRSTHCLARVQLTFRCRRLHSGSAQANEDQAIRNGCTR
jgi:hypothetical protein